MAIHTGKLGILEVKALIKYFIHGHLLNHCQKYSWTTKNADRWPFQGIQYFWWWVIKGTGTLNILDYILYRDARESIFLWHWSCRHWHMLGGLSCCSYKGNFLMQMTPCCIKRKFYTNFVLFLCQWFQHKPPHVMHLSRFNLLQQLIIKGASSWSTRM